MSDTTGDELVEKAAHTAPNRTGPEDDTRISIGMRILLQEVRVLQQGTQVLTAFLIILPFNQGFAHSPLIEKWVYLATFLCSLASMILLSAPAAQHRVAWPLRHPARFQRFSTRMTVAGLIPLSLALILATQLVVGVTFGRLPGLLVALVVAALVLAVWWLVPLMTKRRLHAQPPA